MDAKTISTWLAILTALAAGYARFIALEESRDNATKWITELSAEQRRLSERVDVLERDRSMLERLHQIEMRLAGIEGQLKERRR